MVNPITLSGTGTFSSIPAEDMSAVNDKLASLGFVGGAEANPADAAHVYNIITGNGAQNAINLATSDAAYRAEAKARSANNPVNKYFLPAVDAIVNAGVMSGIASAYSPTISGITGYSPVPSGVSAGSTAASAASSAASPSTGFFDSLHSAFFSSSPTDITSDFAAGTGKVLTSGASAAASPTVSSSLFSSLGSAYKVASTLSSIASISGAVMGRPAPIVAPSSAGVKTPSFSPAPVSTSPPVANSPQTAMSAAASKGSAGGYAAQGGTIGAGGSQGLVTPVNMGRATLLGG